MRDAPQAAGGRSVERCLSRNRPGYQEGPTIDLIRSGRGPDPIQRLHLNACAAIVQGMSPARPAVLEELLRAGLLRKGSAWPDLAPAGPPPLSTGVRALDLALGGGL